MSEISTPIRSYGGGASRLDGGRRGWLRRESTLDGASQPRRPAQARSLILADLAVLAAVAAAVGGLHLLGSPIDGILIYGWLLLGPGAAWTWLSSYQRTSLVALLVPATGLSLFTLLGSMMAVWHQWHPVPAFWALVVLSAVGGVLGHLRCWATGRVALSRLSPAWRSGGGWFSWAVIVLGVVLGGLAVVTEGSRPVGDYGLLAAMPLLAVAGAMITAGFVVALVRDQLSAMAGAVLAMIVLLRAVPVLLTRVPQLFYTYAHLGVTELIATTGRTHPDIDIYSSWPGFFAAMAWLDCLHVIAQQTVAHWFPVVAHVLLALGVCALARALGANRRAALTAAFFAEVCNWVGQDYYSPQAVGLVLALASLALLLGLPRRRVPWLALIPFTALVITHQLTPVWVAGVAVALTLLRRVRPWPVAALMVVIMGIDVALNIEAVAPYGLLSGFRLSNASSNVASVGVPGRQFALLMVRIPSVITWCGAAVALLWRWRRRRPVLVPGVIALSSFLILGGQSYGGEAIFRVFLYGLFGCSVLIGELIDAFVGRQPGRHLRHVVTGVAAVALAVVGMQASLGQWVVGTLAPADVAQAHSLYERIHAPATIMTVGAGLPTRPVAAYADFVPYDSHYDDTLMGKKGFREARFDSDADLAQLHDILGPQRYPLYLVFSQQQKTQARYLGLMAPQDYDRFQSLIAASPEWEQQAGFAPGLDVYRWAAADRT